MARPVRLRPWQKTAFERFLASESLDFLAVATPGAGKTTFALTCARHELGNHPGRRLIVVAPTAHLKHQWAQAASRLQLHLDPKWTPSTGGLPADMHGVVTTYQQVSMSAGSIAALAKGAFVIFDEIHHAGDERAWGDALRLAFDGAGRRLCLSGTPFRSDTRSIPFVRYVMDQAESDSEYGYAEALKDGRVVRPVYFPRTNGHMEWQAPDGQIYSAGFDDPLDRVRAAQRLRTALSPEGDWLPTVLRSANDRLTEVRRSHPEAAALVIAADQEHARDIASLLKHVFNQNATVVLSDDPSASARIQQFAEQTTPWLVAVRMVSEGVDIPRLRVGVYATTTTTELFFRQAVGRLVRWTPGVRNQRAWMFIPDDARLRALVYQIADSRKHSLRKRQEYEQRQDDGTKDPMGAEQPEQLSLFAAISAVATDHDPHEPAELSEAGFDDPLPTDDHIPINDPSLDLLLPPAPPLAGGASIDAARAALGLDVSRGAHKRMLRGQNTTVVRDLATRTGLDHAHINRELNKMSRIGRISDATVEQLERRLRHAERWLNNGH